MNEFHKDIELLTGCYRFADGKAIKLIENTRCDTWENSTCGLQMKIQAPIGARYNSQSCQLDWRESRHTISGYWRPFTEALHEVQLNTTVHSVTLQVSDTSLYHKGKLTIPHFLTVNQCVCLNSQYQVQQIQVFINLSWEWVSWTKTRIV